jgi:hypothetical protein
MRSDWMRSVHESRSNVDTPDCAGEIAQALACARPRSTTGSNPCDVVFAAPTSAGMVDPAVRPRSAVPVDAVGMQAEAA